MKTRPDHPIARALLDRLHERRLAGKPVWAAAAHDIASARTLEKTRADFLVFHPDFLPSPNALLGGLRPLGNANEKMRAAIGEILSAVSIPVFAGICGSDPFLLSESFFQDLKTLGAAGVQNFPTLGLLNGMFRTNLEESGIGFGREIEVLAEAPAAGLAVAPIVFTAEEARAAASRADLVVLHPVAELDFEAGKAHAPRAKREALSAMAAAAKNGNPAIILLCHVGFMESAEEASHAWEGLESLDGFFVTAAAEKATALITALSKTARR